MSRNLPKTLGARVNISTVRIPESIYIYAAAAAVIHSLKYNAWNLWSSGSGYGCNV